MDFLPSPTPVGVILDPPMKPARIARLRILYVLLLILIGISVVPLWFYGSKMMSMNREKLETQESVLQTITSQSLAQVIFSVEFLLAASNTG